MTGPLLGMTGPLLGMTVPPIDAVARRAHGLQVPTVIFHRDERTAVHVRLTSGILSAVLLAGCASLPAFFKDPDLKLQRVVVRGVGLTGGTMDLIVGVYNPNNFDLHGTRLQVGLDVEDSHVGDVEYASDFQVQKGDTTAVTLPVQFNWNGLAGAVRSALGYGELPYKLTGQLTVETPFGDRKIPFTHEGRAPLTRVGRVVPTPAGP